MRDDYDDETERERYEKLFGTAEEREAEARELAERQAQTRRDETLAWARQRAERQRTSAPVVEKTFAQKKQDEAAATNYWKRYIRDQLDSANMALTKAIAQAIVDEERRCDQADFDLRTIIIDVRDRFDEMETRLLEIEARMSKRRGAATPACDGTPRGFDLDRLREWRH